MIPELRIEDYSYPLDESRIAKYPLPLRDSSKLLVYRDAKVSETIFRELPELLPEDSILVFNDTKVVPARLHFRRESGARIEIFCLSPAEPAEYATAFASTSKCSWNCVVGNVKRWKGDVLVYDIPEGTGGSALSGIDLRATLIGREGETCIVEFTWKGGAEFSQVLELCGQIPIPPYLNRDSEEIDIERYQTVYSRIRGSVAAPTAGLHFTENVLGRISARGIGIESICLHVGAGTFLPVKSQLISGHPMHREPFVVRKSFLEDLLQGRKRVVAVGTTSVRTLESLYYIGAGIIEEGEPRDVEQWAPYVREYGYSLEESLRAIVEWLERNSLEELSAGTRIIIVPGFKFRVVDMLITNFHQSESTLILLVSAFVAGDWRTIYDYALANDFRFLSYGDSSLLFRK